MKVSIDTRTLEPGDIYVPIKGRNFDGHDYINKAIEKGASKILDVDLAEYAKKYRRKLKAKIIAITGSAGKTTTKDMLYYILRQKYKVMRSRQNENNDIGVPLNLLRADGDTEIILLELAMRGKGEIKRLTQIARPTHVVITSIGMTHIELLKKRKNIATAKAEIFLPQLQWEKKPRIVFLNSKTDYYNLLVKKAEKNKYKVFSFAGDTKPEQNLNLCFQVGHHFGLTDEEITQGIVMYQPSDKRLIVKKIKDITLIDDTYNANPDGMRYALEYLKGFNGRKILVFGDMLELGEFALKEHQKIVNEAINAGVALIYTYGPISQNMKSKKIPIFSFADKSKLLEMLKLELKKDDVVLIKGSRGMKMETVVEGVMKENI